LGLVVPNEYGMGDLEALGELDERINGFGGAHWNNRI